MLLMRRNSIIFEYSTVALKLIVGHIGNVPWTTSNPGRVWCMHVPAEPVAPSPRRPVAPSFEPITNPIYSYFIYQRVWAIDTYCSLIPRKHQDAAARSIQSIDNHQASANPKQKQTQTETQPTPTATKER